MSLYGLRLRTQGPAQPQVRCCYLLLHLVTLCRFACLSCQVTAVYLYMSLAHYAGFTGPNSKAATA